MARYLSVFAFALVLGCGSDPTEKTGGALGIKPPLPTHPHGDVDPPKPGEPALPTTKPAAFTCQYLDLGECEDTSGGAHVVAHDVERGDVLLIQAGLLDEGQEVFVDDQRTTRHTLVLTGLSAAAWNVKVASLPALVSVIALTETTKQIAIPHEVPVEFKGMSVAVHLSNDLERDPTLESIRDVTGLTIHEFAGCTTVGELPAGSPGRHITVRAEPKCTQRTPAGTALAGAAVRWKEGTGATIDGNIVTSSVAAMTTSANAHSSGKYYFEYDLVQWPGSPETSFGLTSFDFAPLQNALREQGASLFGDGTVRSGFEMAHGPDDAKLATGSRVGFAVDLDQGFFYVSVDGAWTSGFQEHSLLRPPVGRPGDSAGYAIARYAELMPTVSVDAGTTIGIVTDPGKLRYPAPAGFVAGW